MKSKQLKKLTLLTLAASAIMVSACNGGNTNSGTQPSVMPSVDFSGVTQYATPSTNTSPSAASLTRIFATTAGSCFQINNQNITPGAWWTSGSFNIKNTCSSAQSISGLQIRVSSNNYPLSASSFSINSISGATFPAPVYWAPVNSTTTTTTSPDGHADLLMTLATDASGYLAAGSSLSVSLGYNPNGVTPGTFTVVIDGDTPVLNGAVNVQINATTLKTVCGSTASCNMPVRLIGQNGLFDQVIAVINNANAGTSFTVPIIGLNPGSYTLSINNSALPASASFVASNPVDIVGSQTASDSVTFSVTDPVITTGGVSYTIAKPAGISLQNNTFIVTLLDGSQRVVSGGSATATFGQAVTFSNLPAGKYNLASYGLADAQIGIYYDPLSVDTTITAGKTTPLTPAFIKTNTTPVTVVLNVSGLANGESATITLTDNFAGKQFTYNTFKVYNGSNALKLLPSDVVTVNVASSSKYNPVPATTYTVPATSGGQLTIDFVQPNPDPVVPSHGASYDYVAPFKDYNNKIVLSVNNVSSAKALTFTSNFQQQAGWGTCFGQSVYSLNFTTTANGGSYVTTVTPQDSSKLLDLTKTCDIMGTNSGNAVVLPGVVDPILSAVKITQADNKVVNLPIVQPCAATNCKDPGNGYVNAGYYAQWAVWGRQYNPYKMPFDRINDIIYAFIGFDANTGNIKTLDASADSWGMSAVSRAMLEYPYMHAHLSFGGWTNNGVTTAPMFETLASSQSSMNNFANQAITLMRKTGFTGIDIDWEWWSDYGNNVAPAKKMLAFYTTLRSALDKAGAADGKKYTLTIAVNGGSDRILALQNPANPNSVANFWAQVGTLMDNINVMNYDYHGSWDSGSPAYFQATYDFSNTGGHLVGKTEGWSIKSSMATYIASGVSAKKLVAGIPLYVRTMKVVAAGSNGGLFQSVSGAGFGDYETGILDYKCLLNPVNDPVNGCGSANPLAGLNGLIHYSSTQNTGIFNQYGLEAMQPWAYSPATGSFVSYDDVWSATQKAKAVKNDQLGGTMFWELDGDSTNPAISIVKAVHVELSK